MSGGKCLRSWCLWQIKCYLPLLNDALFRQVESYATDPLVHHGGMKVSFVIQLMNAIAKIERSLPKLTLPILTLHGSPDKLCDIKGSYLLMDTVSSQDKTLKVMLGLSWLGSGGGWWCLLGCELKGLLSNQHEMLHRRIAPKWKVCLDIPRLSPDPYKLKPGLL